MSQSPARRATTEPIRGHLIRLHPNHGPDTVWTCAAHDDGVTVEIKLAPRPPTMTELGLLLDELHALGYQRIRWGRYRDATHRTRTPECELQGERCALLALVADVAQEPAP